MLRLHPGETLDRAQGVEVRALEQQLTRQRPAVQLAEGDGPGQARVASTAWLSSTGRIVAANGDGGQM